MTSKKRQIKQKDLKRQPASKNPRARILIICEDSKSASGYFEKLKYRFGITTAEVIILGEECDSAPINVYQYGKYYLEKKDDDFNHVFFVIDKDSHTTYQQAINAILGLASKRKYQKINIKAITSVPCFEIWLMLHVKYSTRFYENADKLIKALKQQDDFSDYAKNNTDYFDAIIGKIDTAIKNSEKLYANSKQVSCDNPSTLIHEIANVFKELEQNRS